MTPPSKITFWIARSLGPGLAPHSRLMVKQQDRPLRNMSKTNQTSGWFLNYNTRNIERGSSRKRMRRVVVINYFCMALLGSSCSFAFPF